MLWLGIGMIVLALVLLFTGSGPRVNFGSFRGNYAERTSGNTTMNYSENNTGTAPAAPAAPKWGERLRVWVAFAILIGGFVITVLKYLAGTS